MNFFQLQNKLFYSKKTDAGYLDIEGVESFTPFLINRWLSFYDPNVAVFANETLNKYSNLFDDKQRCYRFYYNLIPALKFKRIKYIKKIKKQDDVDDIKDSIAIMAKNNNISVREINQYIDLSEDLNK